MTPPPLSWIDSRLTCFDTLLNCALVATTKWKIYHILDQNNSLPIKFFDNWTIFSPIANWISDTILVGEKLLKVFTSFPLFACNANVFVLSLCKINCDCFPYDWTRKKNVRTKRDKMAFDIDKPIVDVRSLGVRNWVWCIENGPQTFSSIERIWNKNYDNPFAAWNLVNFNFFLTVNIFGAQNKYDFINDAYFVDDAFCQQSPSFLPHQIWQHHLSNVCAATNDIGSEFTLSDSFQLVTEEWRYVQFICAG